MIDCTAPFEDIGLEALSMQLKTSNGNMVNITLNDSETDKNECNDETNNLEVVSYLTMKHHISQESYHEMSMHYSELPRSHRVCYVAKYIAI